jgi:hypothetical protein
MPLREAIIAKVRAGAPKPTDLLRELAGQYSSDEIKQVVLRLLQDGELELTGEMHLRLIEEAA